MSWTPEHPAQLEAELRELKRTFRAVRASVRHWEALCQEYLVLYTAVPA